MTPARRRHPALARKIESLSIPLAAPGIRATVITSNGIVTAELDPEREALVALIEEARESAEWRGHSDLHDRFLSTTQSRITCGVCGMEADANTKPPANGIDIGGELVALNCEEEK
jgi:hypothetical protein